MSLFRKVQSFRYPPAECAFPTPESGPLLFRSEKASPWHPQFSASDDLAPAYVTDWGYVAPKEMIDKLLFSSFGKWLGSWLMPWRGLQMQQLFLRPVSWRQLILLKPDRCDL